MYAAAKYAFFGDMMFSRGIDKVWSKQEDRCGIWENFDKFFLEDTVKIANFESPVSGDKATML